MKIKLTFNMAYIKIILTLIFTSSLLAQSKFDFLNMRMHKFVDDDTFKKAV